MTAARWEYASVVWTDVIRKITKSDPEYEKLSPEIQREWAHREWAVYPWREQTYFIWLPGATKPETRHSWSSGEKAYKVNGLEIMNELGADGWEVIASVVKASSMGPNLGREEAGFPIHTETMLKRPVG